MALMKHIVKLMNNDGWQLIAMRGPHWQFVHPFRPGRVTISGDLSHDVGRGAMRSLMRQTQLSFKGRKHDGALSGSH